MMRRWIGAMFLTFLLPGLAARGDEPTSKDSAADKERLEILKRQAADYEMILDTSTPAKLALHRDPLLRFTNPVGGVTDGIIVMWTEGKRPAVFAQIFQVKGGLWIHEFQSLASAGLSLRLGETTKWNPQQAAADFRRLPDAPRAAENAFQRLVQMKEQAARFSAVDDFRIHPSDPETSRYHLRLLSKPLYRYQDKTAGINDGAVFGFVHGTDPELFLILEHRGNGDKAGWYYALVPMTCWAVKAELAGKEIWSVAERSGKTTAKDPYHVWIHRPGK